MLCRMKLKFTNKLKALKPSLGFLVSNEKDRARVLREARDLRMAGEIDFEVTTREVESGWKVVAV